MKELSIWKSKEYYTKAKEGSMDYSHPGMKILQKYIDGKVSKILDIGCGEGTRLARLINKNITIWEKYENFIYNSSNPLWKF